MRYGTNGTASMADARAGMAASVPGFDLQNMAVEAQAGAGGKEGATRLCPVCGAVCFADMDVCYGCLHEFEGTQDGMQPEAVAHGKPVSPAFAKPAADGGTQPQASHVHVDLGSVIARVKNAQPDGGCNHGVACGEPSPRIVITFTL